MNFFNYLEGLRRKSPEERNRFAITVSATVTFIIIVVWIMTLSIRSLSTPLTPAEVDRGPGIVSNIAESISVGFYTVVDGIGDLIDKVF